MCVSEREEEGIALMSCAEPSARVVLLPYKLVSPAKKNYHTRDEI